MNTKTKEKMKMLQIPVTEKQFDTLKEKADKERKLLNAQPIVSERGVGDAEGQKSLADKLEQNRQNELKKDLVTAERIGSKMDRDNNGVSGRGTLRFGRHNPFRFSTLSYPRNVTNNLANGHYLLFYVLSL